jgi:hypothetical protein
MSYHESFWVVVGTAAPVIGLANTVSITDAINTWIESKHSKDDFHFVTFLFSVVIVSSLTSFIMEGAVLIIALQSLAANKDAKTPISSEVCISVGLFAVLFTLAYSITLKFSLKEGESSVSSAPQRNSGVGFPEEP